MANSSTATVKGKGKVLLKFTSGKILSLSNILFVLSLRKNLVSSTLIDIVSLKIVQQTGKVVIMPNGNFVRKGYRSGGLLVLNVATQVNNEIVINSAYIAKSIDLWHRRLRHVNFSSLKRLRNMCLIPNVNTENCSKCHVCVETKFAKKPFKSVTIKKTELSELVHSNLADFKHTISKCGKKRYITFVDDYSRHTKVYLLN